jgi:arylsulfatase A-like enzyme
VSYPPNIVLIVLDELGYYELSCMGHPLLETPYMDRVAAEGMRFTQMLAGGPVCAPTRCCLMTGKHLGHASVRENSGENAIRADEMTLADILKRAGYATGGFGKWGLGGRGTTGVPENHGFDEFFGYYDQVHAHTFFPEYLIFNSTEVPLPGNTGALYEGRTFAQYRIFEEALRFIRKNKNRPFFCYCPWTPPHGLWGLPEDEPSWQKYKGKDWDGSGQFKPDDAQRYAAMVNMVDRQIGEILMLLKVLEIENQTLLIVCGDNGGQRYFANDKHPHGFFAPSRNPHSGRLFRGEKGLLYEGGLRVPFLVRWPGRISAGSVSRHLGYFPDIMPTLAELAEMECPDEIDGLSFLPELMGPDRAGRSQKKHEYLYWEYGGQIAVRRQNWKAYKPTDGAWELYDLDQDIEEKHDIASQHPELLDSMKAYAQEAHKPHIRGQILDVDLCRKDHTQTKKPLPHEKRLKR